MFKNEDNELSLEKHLQDFVGRYYNNISKNDKEVLLNRISSDRGNKRYAPNKEYISGQTTDIDQYHIAHNNEPGQKDYELDELKHFPDINSKEFNAKVYPTDSPIHQETEKQIKQLITKFTNNSSQVAKDLKELLDEKNTEVTYRVRNDWSWPNGNCAFKKGQNGDKNKLVICVCDINKTQNKDALPQILAHELGHALDFNQRPDALKTRYMDGSETAADLCGSALLFNADIKERGFSDFMGKDYDQRIAAGQDTTMLYTPDGGFRRGNFVEAHQALERANTNTQTKEKNPAQTIMALRGLSPTPKHTVKQQTTTKEIQNLSQLRQLHGNHGR
ncbi:MAG: hypothetical protein Q4F75_05510 [Pseudomonadota bacterium]|nr:hypothetical protein [Pseudomonadota bacterium]